MFLVWFIKLLIVTVLDIISSCYRSLGFGAFGVVDYVRLSDSLGHLREWVDRGFHGELEYMARSLDRRDDVRCLMPSTESVVVLLKPYKPSVDQSPDAARIASFAWGEDYHTVIKRDINKLLTTIQAWYPQLRGRAVVDSAPAFEREWAVRAGLGWVGRSSLLINKEWGSYTLIGLLLLDTRVEPTAGGQVENGCGECRRCQKACPGGAISGLGYIDARRCVSYQTQYQSKAQGSQSGYIFGCDECLRACPYNKAVEPADLAEPINLTPEQWREMSADEFKNRFGHTPLYRVGLEKIKQNCDVR